MLGPSHCASRDVARLQGSIRETDVGSAREKDPARGITGLLCFSGDIFIQVLEGGRDEVCELFNTIVRDRRHDTVRLLTFEEIRQRKFGAWTMGHVDLTRVNPSLLLKYHEKATLDPFICSGHATMALLDELIATASITSRNA